MLATNLSLERVVRVASKQGAGNDTTDTSSMTNEDLIQVTRSVMSLYIRTLSDTAVNRGARQAIAQ